MHRLKAFSARIIAVQSFIVLAVVYILFVPVLSFIVRKRGVSTAAGWLPWTYRTDSLDDVRLQ